MPLYEYYCLLCDNTRVEMRLMIERDLKPLPACERCKKEMQAAMSPVAGYVRNPAAGHTRGV